MYLRFGPISVTIMTCCNAYLHISICINLSNITKNLVVDLGLNVILTLTFNLDFDLGRCLTDLILDLTINLHFVCNLD